MIQDNEKEEWGDDELIGEDLPGMMLLQRANLTAFFNGKGYEGSYPALLYFYDEAEALHDEIILAITQAQSADREEHFSVSVFTKFTGSGDAVKGDVEVKFERSDILPAELTEDIITIMLCGIKNWLEEAYGTHGRKAIITWGKRTPDKAAGIITSIPKN